MKPFRHQTALYILAFLLALAVRLIRLGTWTLTDIEIMTCPGGCIGGGGQPRMTSNDVRKARILRWVHNRLMFY